MRKYRMTFDSIDKAYGAFCGQHFCDSCPLSKESADKKLSCKDFKNSFHDKAAELMGLEVIEVEDKPHLTEAELAICKALGAKWVSRDGEGYNYMGVVKLWREKPQMGNSPCYYLTAGTYIATCELNCFPSLSPGDCVNVEELMK